MKRRVTISAGIGALALITAGCASPTVTKAATPAKSAATTAPPAATPNPTASTAGPVGTTFTVSGTDQDNQPYSYDVTLAAVEPNATPDNSFDAPTAGDQLYGAEFKITGDTGNSSDDANSDAIANGSNSQVYDFTANGLAAGTNFNNGEFNVAPGQTSIGWVAFELPASVKVATVQWSPDSFGDGPLGTWTVANANSSAPAVTEPWAVVSAYYSDITMRHYHAAWTLLGYSPQGGGYASFVAGYAGTGQQTVAEISESGDQVTFTLTSDNGDGTTQTYQGTDTVTGGRIMAADVTQTG
jgi:hypothetical protein